MGRRRVVTAAFGRRRGLRTLALLAIVAVAAAACSNNGGTNKASPNVVEGGTLRVGTTSTIDSFRATARSIFAPSEATKASARVSATGR